MRSREATKSKPSTGKKIRASFLVVSVHMSRTACGCPSRIFSLILTIITLHAELAMTSISGICRHPIEYIAKVALSKRLKSETMQGIRAYLQPGKAACSTYPPRSDMPMPMSLPMKQALLVLLPLAANLAMTACNGVLFDCNNRLVASVDSPDKSIKAVVFERTCGATTGFNQQGLDAGGSEQNHSNQKRCKEFGPISSLERRLVPPIRRD